MIESSFLILNISYLPFISDDKLKRCVKTILDKASAAVEQADEKVFSNVIDPFSAVFDSAINGISLSDWLENEKNRQIQKTLQNALGDFHQDIISSMSGWENLGIGGLVDVRNEEKKIIAEIKNKYNTTKGSDKKTLYDNLLVKLSERHNKGFTGYYVEIIPSKHEPYNDFFTPSDNVTKKKRPKYKYIRVIDGKSFYEIASGDARALRKLYDVLPIVIADTKGVSAGGIENDKLFFKLFDSVY